MEGQEGLGERPADQRLYCSGRVPRLGGRVHLRQGVTHAGTRTQGDTHCSGIRFQGNADAMAGQIRVE